MPYFQGDAFTQNLNKVERTRPIADAKGAEIAHVVLAWYLAQQAIDVIIPGAKNSEQLLNNL
ncbi:hypothetical protein YSY43_22010 [Paenibacillus sp. YSY-4.3]